MLILDGGMHRCTKFILHRVAFFIVKSGNKQYATRRLTVKFGCTLAQIAAISKGISVRWKMRDRLWPLFLWLEIKKKSQRWQRWEKEPYLNPGAKERVCTEWDPKNESDQKRLRAEKRHKKMHGNEFKYCHRKDSVLLALQMRFSTWIEQSYYTDKI